MTDRRVGKGPSKGFLVGSEACWEVPGISGKEGEEGGWVGESVMNI